MNGIGSFNPSSTAGMFQSRHRPDASKLAGDLFTKLDTSNKGYLEIADLQSAFSNLSSTTNTSTTNTTSVDEIFSKLDMDGDGKVTKDEMSSSIKRMADQLDQQFQEMRMQGGMARAQGMPPPPPPENDEGLTQDQLKEKISELGDSNSRLADMMSSVLNNFSNADTDGDGKVTFQEAMNYQQQARQAASSNSTGVSASSNNHVSEAQWFRQLMELARSYGTNPAQPSQSSTLSAIA